MLSDVRDEVHQIEDRQRAELGAISADLRREVADANQRIANLHALYEANRRREADDRAAEVRELWTALYVTIGVSMASLAVAIPALLGVIGIVCFHWGAPVPSGGP